MKFVYSERYEMDIGPHVFPTQKYRLVKDALLERGIARAADFIPPGTADPRDIELVHDKSFVADMNGLRWSSRTMYSELPLTREIIDGYYLMAAGTVTCARQALADGIALHIGGGFHHAFADHAEGFCYVNDVAVAIRRLQTDGAVARAAVVDCDLHQGNGTASIFAGDPRVFTFSIHEEDIYPIKVPGTVDIGLDPGTTDDQYLGHLQSVLPRIVSEHQPEFAVFVAGADPYRGDQLGRLGLTIEGLRRRDEYVIGSLRAAQIPTAVVLAGGYAFQVEDTVEIHVNTCRVAAHAA